MSLDNVGGGVSVQNSAGIGLGDAGKTGSVTSTAFNRLVSVESDVESTEGLKLDKPRSKRPSIRDRIITPVDPSKTRSVKQMAGRLAGKLAGKVVDKLLPDSVQEKASSFKTKASKKAKAALEVVSEKAMALKSKTIGKLLRMIRSENFAKVDSGATQNQGLKEKISSHNSDVEKLADLKTQLKNEETGLKEFRKEFKDALELVEHPEKFVKDSTLRTITIPGGESRTISSALAATRAEMVELIKQDIMGTQEYQDYDLKMSEKAEGGTQLHLERQNLKTQMKERAEEMVVMFQKEVSDDLDSDVEAVESRRKEFTDTHRHQVSERGTQYEQRTEEARKKMEAKEAVVSDLKEERVSTREVMQGARKTKSKLKKDASELRSTAVQMRSRTARDATDHSAGFVQKKYDDYKTSVGDMKKRLSEIPDELKTERQARKDARTEFDELDSGRARKKDVKDSAKEWEAADKKFDKEEKQLEKQAKKKTSDFKKGLG